MIKHVQLMARKPGEDWGVRSRLNEANARQHLPENNRLHLSQEQVEDEAKALAITWHDRIKDETEYKVVAI